MFSNHTNLGNPKMALNHTSVFLKKNNFQLLENSDDDVPDEEVDANSLSRIKNTVLSRESITSNLKKFSTKGNYF